MLQITASHRSVRYKTSLGSSLPLKVLPPSFEHGLVLLATLDRPFKPKYGTVSQVLLQLVVARTAIKIFTSLCPDLLGCTFKFDNLNTSEKLETGTTTQCSLIRLDLPCVIVYDEINY